MEILSVANSIKDQEDSNNNKDDAIIQTGLRGIIKNIKSVIENALDIEKQKAKAEAEAMLRPAILILGLQLSNRRRKVKGIEQRA